MKQHQLRSQTAPPTHLLTSYILLNFTQSCDYASPASLFEEQRRHPKPAQGWSSNDEDKEKEAMYPSG